MKAIIKINGQKQIEVTELDELGKAVAGLEAREIEFSLDYKTELSKN